MTGELRFFFVSLIFDYTIFSKVIDHFWSVKFSLKKELRNWRSLLPYPCQKEKRTLVKNDDVHSNRTTPITAATHPPTLKRKFLLCGGAIFLMSLTSIQEREYFIQYASPVHLSFFLIQLNWMFLSFKHYCLWIVEIAYSQCSYFHPMKLSFGWDFWIFRMELTQYPHQKIFQSIQV